MSKWIMTALVVFGLGCAGSTAQARSQEAPAAQQPAPEPSVAETAPGGSGARLERERLRAAMLAAEEAAVAAQAEGGRGRGMARIYAGQTKREKGAWLGVVTSPVDGALRKQTKLTHKGIGLVVERVEPKSPAAEAGLEQYDIIEKLNDQWLVNSQQFGVLVRMHKPGDAITLTVIRAGEPQELKATLVEKDVPVLSDAGSVNWVGAVPGEEPSVFSVAPLGQAQFDIALPKLMMSGNSLLDFDAEGDMSIVVTDDLYTYKLSKKDDKRTLDVSNKDGTSVFSGPIDTPEQRESIPEDVREKLDKFGGMPSLRRLHEIRPPAVPEAPVSPNEK